MLVQLPDGAQLSYHAGGKSLGDGIIFYDGRGYFVGADGSVQYFRPSNTLSAVLHHSFARAMNAPTLLVMVKTPPCAAMRSWT